MIGYVKDNYIVCLRFFIISYANLNVPDLTLQTFVANFAFTQTTHSASIVQHVPILPQPYLNAIQKLINMLYITNQT